MTLAIRLGSVHITFKDIWNSIFNYNETLELMLVRDVRIPRALAVLFTGGVLGVTGAMIQGVTRNPIAEPSILGISQGATLVIAIFYAAGIGITTRNVMIASFIGALITGIIVLGFISILPFFLPSIGFMILLLILCIKSTTPYCVFISLISSTF